MAILRYMTIFYFILLERRLLSLAHGALACKLQKMQVERFQLILNRCNRSIFFVFTHYPYAKPLRTFAGNALNG